MVLVHGDTSDDKSAAGSSRCLIVLVFCSLSTLSAPSLAIHLVHPQATYSKVPIV
jgi:hypothetical protein